MVTASILTIEVYNLNGIKITKLIDSLTRALLTGMKTISVWVIGIFLTVLGSFDVESTSAVVNFIKIIGFVCIVVGTLIYNKLLCPRYFD